MKKKQKEIYINTKTTGLDFDSEIIQIGIIDRKGKVLLDTYVQCQDDIQKEAIEIHGINKKTLENAPTWPEVHDQVSKILKEADVVYSYNSEFVKRLLAQTARRYNLKIPKFNSFCLMEKYANSFNDECFEKLTIACRELGIFLFDLGLDCHAIESCEVIRLLKMKMNYLKSDKVNKDFKFIFENGFNVEHRAGKNGMDSVYLIEYYSVELDDPKNTYSKEDLKYRRAYKDGKVIRIKFKNRNRSYDYEDFIYSTEIEARGVVLKRLAKIVSDRLKEEDVYLEDIGDFEDSEDYSDIEF